MEDPFMKRKLEGIFDPEIMERFEEVQSRIEPSAVNGLAIQMNDMAKNLAEDMGAANDRYLSLKQAGGSSQEIAAAEREVEKLLDEARSFRERATRLLTWAQSAEIPGADLN